MASGILGLAFGALGLAQELGQAPAIHRRGGALALYSESERVGFALMALAALCFLIAWRMARPGRRAP